MSIGFLTTQVRASWERKETLSYLDKEQNGRKFITCITGKGLINLQRIPKTIERKR